MNGPDGITGWKGLKQRLSFNFKALGCCGAIWSPRTPTMPVIEEEEEEPIFSHRAQSLVSSVGQALADNNSTVVTGPGMNLAMALAAERSLRGANGGPMNQPKPVKTLVRLIEETDGVDLRKKKNERKDNKDDNDNGVGVGVGVGVGGNEGDWMCCVCMERSKGAAFVPCGHTFCRVCSRELWVNRGSCPICNRSVVQILDIF
ncbi:hypothetical protein Tsubulata_013849 [Turnera subulata]|uniref:RING-type domain-containing protein n=1 Tax=Turnera subulata TaxID=218843 RepID=A0A9Q0G451_9ROSI|nr:hypothetical protein Tsubulata_013849 [Turnera subulata]